MGLFDWICYSNKTIFFILISYVVKFKIGHGNLKNPSKQANRF